MMRRGLVSLGLLVTLVCLWLGVSQAKSIMAWHFARTMAEESPELAIIPTNPPDTRSADLSGKRFERFGMSFQVPWRETIQDRTLKSTASVAFKDGGVIVVFNPVTAMDQKALVGLVREQFGQPAVRSQYDLLALELSATPDQNRLWKSAREHALLMMLLGLKRVEMVNHGAIYRFDTGFVRGFQFGNPSIAPYTVRLHMFDGTDRSYEILCMSPGNQKPVISQAELNGLIASFRTLSDTQREQAMKERNGE